MFTCVLQTTLPAPGIVVAGDLAVNTTNKAASSVSAVADVKAAFNISFDVIFAAVVPGETLELKANGAGGSPIVGSSIDEHTSTSMPPMGSMTLSRVWR